LSGPDHLRDAAERVATESRVLGTVRSAVFSSEQVAQLQVLADARRDSEFARFVDRIAKSPEIVSH